MNTTTKLILTGSMLATAGCAFGPKQVDTHEGRPVYRVECMIEKGLFGIGGDPVARCQKQISRVCKGARPEVLTTRRSKMKQVNDANGYVHTYYVDTNVHMVACG